MAITDWHEWHREYDNPQSELAARMRTVQRHVAEVVAQCAPGPVTVVSICGGEGRELIGALQNHPRRLDVRGRLVELDADNAAVARRRAQEAQLDRFEVVTGDAGVTDSYDGVGPADVVVVSGVFGQLDDDDQMRTIEFLRAICKQDAYLVWTSYRRDEERLEKLRRFLDDRGFEEVEFECLDGDTYRFTVAVSRHTGSLQPFVKHQKIFTYGSSQRRHRDQDTSSMP